MSILLPFLSFIAVRSNYGAELSSAAVVVSGL